MRRSGVALVIALVLVVALALIIPFVVSSSPSRADSTTTTTPATTTTTAGSATTTPLATTTTVGTTTATTTTTVAGTVTIAAVGDTELGNSPRIPANPLAYFAPVKAALAAPILFGNLEGTMTSAGSAKCRPDDDECFDFHVPPSFARVYRAVGFTVLNSANNHSNDYGGPGVVDTSNALRQAGIAQAGRPGQIAVVREGAISVAFVDFAPYPYTNNLLNFAAARRLIDKARRLATLVVVYMHAGAEGANAEHVTKTSEFYVGENRGNPYAFAHAAIDEGASLVIASGPHVLRGMQWYRGHLIAYSLGDFENYYNFATDGDLSLTGILHVTLSASGKFVAGAFTSATLSGSGQVFIDPTAAAAHFVNLLSRQDFGSSAVVITKSGALTNVH
jgi:hypothetical protein